ncbi:phospholipase D family protein [Sulfurisoma sediminicola]|uniref:Putative cardiolipin synthase n=1 Tax=Sulfurisoma sediminicola TaxID=1381557 RepID=A0A497XE30_9PROT|nr:phospholipase D family protein [Sulfurisoma sediminicola]RLJ65262.1 putative cardiolipin synthase [Sulfurisoma sediminicola]
MPLPECFRRLLGQCVAVGTVLLLVSGCAGLPTDIERKESRALTDTETTRLGQASVSLRQAHPDESGFRLLRSGVDALLARLVLAEAAQRSLDVQYYIWHDDLTGRHFANALLRAADRGVRVRVLLDDVGVKPKDEVLLSLTAHPNIEIRLFNPVASRSFRSLSAIGDLPRVNRRMHNKAVIADNQVAILGGRNIGDEYFGAHGEVAFGDLDVLTIGAGVKDVSAAFDRFWNSQVVFPVAALTGNEADSAGLVALRAKLKVFVEEQRDSRYVTAAKADLAVRLAAGSEGMFWGKAHVLFDDPDKIARPPAATEGRLLPQLGRFRSSIRESLLIVSPYFVPGEAGVTWLRALVARGVRVTVLTNSLAATDVGIVHAGYQRYRDALLEGGIRLYELKPEAIEHGRATERKGSLSGSRASLHAKTFVFDRKSVFIGSLNLDPRSIELNTEIGVVCESAPLAEELGGTLERNLDSIAWRLERSVEASGDARIVWVEKTAEGERRHAEEPGVSEWRRFSLWFLGLLPIESQL